MELLVFTVVVLATALAAGGAISYITRRDRRAQAPAPESRTGPPRFRRPAPDPSPPRPPPSEGARSTGSPTPVPEVAPQPPAADAQDPAQSHPGPACEQEDADAAREALRANQRSMGDPGLSTLDRVQALMASQAFALHVTDQPPDQPGDDKRDPRS